jgi:chemotaxis protein CheC
MEKIKLSAFEKDILSEIGNMCVGNATTALAQILGRRIDLELPSARVINVNKLHQCLRVSPEEPVMGIHMQILGGAKGNALMLFSRKDSFALVDILIGVSKQMVGSLTEIGLSALKEVGNIVIGSYLSALSAFTGISAFPSTVTLTNGSTRSLARLAFLGMKKEECEDVIMVEAVFKDIRKDLDGSFFIIFDVVSIYEILKKANSMIKEQKD